jgi:hypothetical protein
MQRDPLAAALIDCAVAAMYRLFPPHGAMHMFWTGTSS